MSGLYEANVTHVRAVVGTPEQRCWVEREQIPQDQHSANVPAAVAGASSAAFSATRSDTDGCRISPRSAALSPEPQ
jgi:hypothetical protein